MNTIFIQIDEYKLINVDFVVSVTLNKNGEHGWVKVDDRDEEGFSKYKVSKEQYENIVKVLSERDFVIGLVHSSETTRPTGQTLDSKQTR